MIRPPPPGATARWPSTAVRKRGSGIWRSISSLSVGSVADGRRRARRDRAQRVARERRDRRRLGALAAHVADDERPLVMAADREDVEEVAADLHALARGDVLGGDVGAGDRRQRAGQQALLEGPRHVRALLVLQRRVDRERDALGERLDEAPLVARRAPRERLPADAQRSDRPAAGHERHDREAAPGRLAEAIELLGRRRHVAHVAVGGVVEEDRLPLAHRPRDRMLGGGLEAVALRQAGEQRVAAGLLRRGPEPPDAPIATEHVDHRRCRRAARRAARRPPARTPRRSSSARAGRSRRRAAVRARAPPRSPGAPPARCAGDARGRPPGGGAR